MFETPLTVVGTIVNDPIRRQVGEQELFKFRLASNSRRRNADGTWETGNSLFITVNCWGRLITGAASSLSRGTPVIVVGDVYTSEYEDREGVRRSSVEMRATAVGPDLSRCAALVQKLVPIGTPGAVPAAPARDVDDTEPPADDPVEEQPLSLTA